MKIKFLVIALLSCSVFTFSNSRAAVSVYNWIDYKGDLLSLDTGKFTSADLKKKSVFPAWADSLKVPPGYKVTLYGSDNFKGGSRVVTSDTRELRFYTCSVIVEQIAPSAVSVYVDQDYRGNSEQLETGNYSTDVETARRAGVVDAKKLTINNGTNKLSSLKISKNYSVILYEKPDFTGNSFAFVAESSNIDIPKLAPEFNDKTEAIEVSKN